MQTIKSSVKLYIAALLWLTSLTLVAQDIPVRPDPPRLVNDFAGLLTSTQAEALEYKLRYFNDTTSNQIVVVTVESLNGYDAASFAFTIGEKWQVGQRDFNNGIVVLVKPKYSNSDGGKAFIAPGYGLEPVVPDATAKRIVENEMIPSFKQGDYYQGIDQATTVLMKLASGEISAKGYNKEAEAPWWVALIPFFIMVFIIVMIGRSKQNSHGIGSRNSNLWTALLLGSLLNNRSHGGSWSNFSGGSSGSSGFGGGSSGFGGGFSGFGGGSFGGGGAGGSW